MLPSHCHDCPLPHCDCPFAVDWTRSLLGVSTGLEDESVVRFPVSELVLKFSRYWILHHVLDPPRLLLLRGVHEFAYVELAGRVGLVQTIETNLRGRDRVCDAHAVEIVHVHIVLTLGEQTVFLVELDERLVLAVGLIEVDRLLHDRDDSSLVGALAIEAASGRALNTVAI